MILFEILTEQRFGSHQDSNPGLMGNAPRMLHYTKGTPFLGARGLP